MKKLILMFMFVLLVGTVSAFEFDDVKYYEEKTTTYTLENFFGLGKNIANLELKTPQNNIVPRGYQKVAEIEIRNGEYDYNEIINRIELYNIKDNMKEVVRNVDYKYKVIVQVPKYKTICDKGFSVNGTAISINCRQEQIELKDKVIWEDFTNNSLLKRENITLGIFTDVKKGDYVEWIINVYGNERLTKWATWTESLNVDLSYYKMDDNLSTTVVLDASGVDDGVSTVNTDTLSADGIINTSLDFPNNATTHIDIADGGNLSFVPGIDSYSISLWVNLDAIGVRQAFIVETIANDDFSYLLRVDADNKVDFFSAEIPSNDIAFSITSVNTLSTGTWHNIVGTVNTTTAKLFIDNVDEGTSAVTANVDGANDGVSIGQQNSVNPMNGRIDEIGIWNRTLTGIGGEVTQLYNGGVGISFTTDFPPIVNVTFPENITYNTTQTLLNYTVVSSGSGFDRCWFSIDGGTTNSSDNDCTLNFTTTSVEGGNTWTVFSNTTGGATGQGSVTFTVNSTIQVDLNIPANDTNFLSTSVDFNCQATDSLSLENLTLIIDGIANFTNSSSGATLINLTTTVNGLTVVEHSWTCIAVDSDNFNASTPVRIFEIKKFQENNQTFNPFTFETKSEEFIINVTIDPSTSPSSANLIYDGTDKGSATITSLGDNNFNISQTINIPLGDGNNSWFFNITIDGIFGSSLPQQQSVGLINLTFCQTAPQNIPYINFTFRNETVNQDDITASITSSAWNYFLGTGTVNKSLSYANATENFFYDFCFNPPNQTLSTTLEIAYTNTESQQRIFSPTLLTLTNITTQQTLFLLPTTLGLFSQFFTQDTIGNTLIGVLAVITRTLGGSTIIVTSDATDGSGVVVFFLNPDVTYTATFSQTGFLDNVFSFVPITDLRTVTMGSVTGVVVNGSTISLGTSYEIQPSNESLNNNTIVTFSFNVTGGETINLISMNITNSTSQLGFQSNAGQGFISENINTNNNTRLFGEFIIQTANETLTIKRVWFVGIEFVGDYSLFRQLTLFNDYGFDEFIKFLIVLATIVGILIFMSGDNQIEDEIKMVVITLVVWSFSIVNWLDTGVVVSSSSTNINALTQFSNQYGIAILTTAGTAYFILRRIFREI